MKSGIDFIGREALQAQLDDGVKKLFVMLLLDPVDHNTDLDPWPWGGEPIYRWHLENNIWKNIYLLLFIFRDDKFCGTVTTTSYGFSLGKQVCLGFVQDIGADGEAGKIQSDQSEDSINYSDQSGVISPEFVKTGNFEVDIFGVRYPAQCRLNPPVLPTKVKIEWNIFQKNLSIIFQ